MTQDEAMKLLMAIAKANDHPDCKGWAEKVEAIMAEAPTAVAPLTGTPVLTDPTEWPQPIPGTGPVLEMKVYADGSVATGPAPLPSASPDEQEAAGKIEGPTTNTDIAV